MCVCVCFCGCIVCMYLWRPEIDLMFHLSGDFSLRQDSYCPGIYQLGKGIWSISSRQRMGAEDLNPGPHTCLTRTSSIVLVYHPLFLILLAAELKLCWLVTLFRHCLSSPIMVCWSFLSSTTWICHAPNEGTCDSAYNNPHSWSLTQLRDCYKMQPIQEFASLHT